MIGPWERIEGSSHDDELDSGVEARIADPLWMLARQWQFGEFRGDDAGSPAAARLEWTSTPLKSYRAGSNGPVTPMPVKRPLERLVEAAPPPGQGAAKLHWSARLAGQISRRLVRSGLHDAIELLRVEFPIPDDEVVALPGAGGTAADLLRRRSFDGAALLAASAARIERTLLAASTATSQLGLVALPKERREAAIDVIHRWQTAVRDRFDTPPVDTWDKERLEHRFSVATAPGPDQVVLTADAYSGGHLDWYSFDMDSQKRQGTDRPTSEKSVTQRITAIPTPVRYAGMPAPRWWAFEEGDVHFGDIAAAPGDLGRLLLADYATVYSNDWYSVPLRLPLGTVNRIIAVIIYDTMGRHTRVPPAALLDDRSPGRRAFRLYELSGDPSIESGIAPLLLLPPSLAGSEMGPALERIEFVRDEAANLAWGIERLVEGPAGRPVDRLQHWRTALSAADTSSAKADGQSSSSSDRPAWRYRLEAVAPPFWIPFVPVRIGSGAQIRLRRARMQQWDLLDRVIVGPKGELLMPERPMVIAEEAVPRRGLALERRWQLARWTDGSVHVWIQRSKRLGTGERSSGVRWDLLLL